MLIIPALRKMTETELFNAKQFTGVFLLADWQLYS